MILQVTLVTGQTAYLIIFNSLKQVWNTATAAFESYNSANWSKYAIAMTEDVPSGNYFVNVPATITTPGAYSFVPYTTAVPGGSPTLGDPPQSPGNFVIGGAATAAPTYLQVIAGTSQNVYFVLINALGQFFNTATSAFENYTLANWASYAIACTEAPGSYNYFGPTPTAVTSPGAYTWTGYIRAGANPAATDAQASPGNFSITLGTYVAIQSIINSVRIATDDPYSGRPIFGENLGSSDQPQFPVNGSNTMFRLKNAPLADTVTQTPAYVWITVLGTGAVARTQQGIQVVDQINGIISFTTAPVAQTSPNGTWADYNYILFTDDKYSEFISRAANLTVSGTTDPTMIPEGLYEAMVQYAAYLAFTALASRYAQDYESSAEGAGAKPQTKSAQYNALAKAAFTQAQTMRTDYYKEQGRRESPAWVNPMTNPPPRFDPITPRK